MGLSAEKGKMGIHLSVRIEREPTAHATMRSTQIGEMYRMFQEKQGVGVKQNRLCDEKSRRLPKVRA